MKLGKVKYCKKCVTPSSSAVPVEFNSDGVCTACTTHGEGGAFDWSEREGRLKKLFKQYKSKNNYDCIIPVSGGKDSYFQIHMVKNVFKMNPLLVTYNGNNWTKTGYENLHNMREAFGCDHVYFTPSIDLLKRMNRIGFKMTGDMNWHAHCGIFTYPFIIAVEKQIPLVIYGEHGFMDLGGMHSYSDYVEFTQRYRLEHCLRGYDWPDFLGHRGGDHIDENELLGFKFPSDKMIREIGVRGIYISNYVKWSGNNNAKIAKQYGFKENDEPFERTFRRISNLDDMHENGIHDYMKYVKFGYGRATDHVCKDIREGKMSREEGIDMVRKMDHIKSNDLYRWLNYVGMSEEEFDAIADSFRDKSVWEQTKQGQWVKDNIWD
ncbi:MAG: N-acetyl sugar amidotransferase [Gammaproteobacteria bacterium]|nr:N-acetyl sugar amidotransferase [Gammaproteobacteria bacterium]